MQFFFFFFTNVRYQYENKDYHTENSTQYIHIFIFIYTLYIGYVKTQLSKSYNKAGSFETMTSFTAFGLVFDGDLLAFNNFKNKKKQINRINIKQEKEKMEFLQKY